jgi:hypothetical protein
VRALCSVSDAMSSLAGLSRSDADLPRPCHQLQNQHGIMGPLLDKKKKAALSRADV